MKTFVPYIETPEEEEERLLFKSPPRPRRRIVNRPEQEIQISIIETFNKIGLARHYKFFHIPNGGGRSKVEAGIFKAMGVMPGVPDIMILPGPYFLEVKALGGRLSPEQLAFQSWCRLNSIPHEVAFSVDTALVWLHRWGIIWRSGDSIKVLKP